MTNKTNNKKIIEAIWRDFKEDVLADKRYEKDMRDFFDNEFAPYILDALFQQKQQIKKMIEGIEEWEETYCEKDEHLLRAIKEKIIKNL